MAFFFILQKHVYQQHNSKIITPPIRLYKQIIVMQKWAVFYSSEIQFIPLAYFIQIMHCNIKFVWVGTACIIK